MAHKNHFRSSLIFSFLLIFFVHTAPAWPADNELQGLNFEKTQGQIKEISRRLKSGQISPQFLENAKQQTEQLTQAANTCINAMTGGIGRLDQEIISLGPVVEHEPAEIVKERKSLIKQKQALLVTLSECRLATTLTARLENEMADHSKQLQAANFFSRSQNFFDRFITALPSPSTFIGELQEYVLQRSGLGEPTPLMHLIFVLLMAFGAFVGFKFFRLLQRQIGLCLGNQDQSQWPAGQGVLSLPIAVAALLGGGYLLYTTHDLQSALYGPWLLLAIGLYCLSLLVFDFRKRLQPSPLPGRDRSTPHKRFNLLAFLAVLLFFSTRLDLADFHALAAILGLVQSLIICCICVVGLWYLWPIQMPENLASLEKSRRTAITVLSTLVMIIELSGYRNFSLFILVGLLGTFLLANLLRLSLFFIDQTIGGFFIGKYCWQQSLRLRLGLAAEDNLSGITWIRLIFKLLAWSMGLLLFLQLWGLPDAWEKIIHGYLLDGFNFGGLVIAPARLIFGVFIFACGWTLVAWLKMQMERKWLRQAGLSPSAQETLVTMTGYCGFGLALLVGLSFAGVSFSNLAVIAGALSVGIGFGLQNIVNNFVSGLIILFERPVKRGDWIRIGNTEGFVQKISVRSTLIQTFDRSDVIVPNSELISNQVTNMMLHDNFGRLIVPIGVAYGSDIELVRTVLLDIAEGNENVVNDGSAPKPVVLFLAFGDNSLNFELRCHLANIDKRLIVKSAMNFEIDRAFRKHKISMPFPQRDVYIKEFPSIAPKATDKLSGPDEEYLP
jgi:potassium-dependent mechanosensitive channel